METLFIDTSALAKLYVWETGTEYMIKLVGKQVPASLTVLSLSRIEVRSAIRRREKGGDISTADADATLSLLDKHWASVYIIQPVAEAVLDVAARLVDAHGLRAYDAVQLAGCLASRTTSTQASLTFVCSDHALMEAAGAENLRVIDPQAEETAGRLP